MEIEKRGEGKETKSVKGILKQVSDLKKFGPSNRVVLRVDDCFFSLIGTEEKIRETLKEININDEVEASYTVHKWKKRDGTDAEDFWVSEIKKTDSKKTEQSVFETADKIEEKENMLKEMLFLARDTNRKLTELTYQIKEMLITQE